MIFYTSLLVGIGLAFAAGGVIAPVIFVLVAAIGIYIEGVVNKMGRK